MIKKGIDDIDEIWESQINSKDKEPNWIWVILPIVIIVFLILSN